MIKTWYIALLLLLFNAVMSILSANGIVAGGIQEGVASTQLLIGGLVDSTVDLPAFLTSFGVPKTFAAFLAFATWFVYAVGFFQLVTVRFISGAE
jgi:hypothetical protein